jgi:hypothetical protein
MRGEYLENLMSGSACAKYRQASLRTGLADYSIESMTELGFLPGSVFFFSRVPASTKSVIKRKIPIGV